MRQCIVTVTRTATSSFHGTGISLFQFPTQKPGLDQECLRINSHTEEGSSGPILPHSYTFVPPVGQNPLIAFLIQAMIPIPNPTDYGWKEEDGKLLPIWTTLPLAKDVLNLDVKCSCKSTCSSSSRCKCIKEKLKCTHLCKCKCVAGTE